MNTKKQGFAPIAVIVILVLLGAGAYVALKNKGETSTVCTLDAKQCPDGSYVSRVGPACEFAACPAGDEGVSEGLVPIDWKIYTDSNYGFEFRYPAYTSIGGKLPNPSLLDLTKSNNYVGNVTIGNPLTSSFNLFLTTFPLEAQIGRSLSDLNKVEPRIVLVNGIEMQQYDIALPNNTRKIYTFWRNDPYTYTFDSGIFTSEGVEDYQTIVSTFKFTN